jgi:predicted dehydrogenase
MRSRTVWQRHLLDDPRFDLVGVQDVAHESLEKAFELGTIKAEHGYLSLPELLERARPDALVVCPVHLAHAEAIEAGLEANCHVLVEKPFTTSLDASVRLTADSESRGLVLGVVQNWRTKSVGSALRRAVQDGRVGRVSHVFFRYVRDRELPHLPGYLFDEAHPMLYALTVHHVDLFRYALDEEIVRVEARAFHPPWSRYRDPSVQHVWMETSGGVRISYVGTISSRNSHLPWENLVVEGELGSLVNESSFSDPPLLLSRRGEEPVDLTADAPTRDPAEQYALADRAILGNFYDAIRNGAELISPARENLGTVAAVEAVREALDTGEPVVVPQFR